MEWVETTGRTLEEAKDAALDELGVDEDDAEFGLLQEPTLGLFGRIREEARVRARVRPTKPRAKEDHRRERRRKGRKSGSDRAAAPADDDTKAAEATTNEGPEEAAPKRHETTAEEKARPADATAAAVEAGSVDDTDDEEEPVNQQADELSLDEQAERATAFLEGLLDEWGLDAEVSHEVAADDEAVHVRATGQELGYLIGPKGATLDAIQELTRTVVQRQSAARTARISVDVGGYRERRREALERFAVQVAEEVQRSGERKVLEPMNAADRKAVHDAVNRVDGVRTSSQGEEPRRRVVIDPA